jgi:hypothetical protein
MSSSAGPSIITNSLVLHLDAADRKSYPGSGTVWRDRSGNEYNGSLVGGAGYNSGNGGSITFDGSNDYVTCGPVLNFGGPSSVGTIQSWVKGTGTFFSNQRQGVGDTRHGWIQCYIPNENVLLNIDTYGGPPYGEVFAAPLNSTPYSTLSGQWNFCSIRINRPLNKYTIGINNYFTTYTRTFTVENYFNFNTIEIGRMNNSTYGTHYFNGQIAQTNVYNRFLSDQEILQNYNATKSRFGLL